MRVETIKTTLVRPHRGQPPEKRIEDRRRRLLDTAFELLARDGWKQLTINNLCSQAKLHKRYFYESFSDLDDVAGAVFDDLAGTIVDMAFKLFRKAKKDELSIDDLVRTALGEFVRYLTDDSRRARVLFSEVIDSPRAAAQRKASINGLAQTLFDLGFEIYGDAAISLIGEQVSAKDFLIGELGASLLIGGSIEAFLAWLDGNNKMSQEQFIEELAALWVIIGNGVVERVVLRHSPLNELG